MAINKNPYLAFERDLTPEQLAEMQALQTRWVAPVTTWNEGGETELTPGHYGGDLNADRFSPTANWVPEMVQRGFGESMEWVPDPSGAGRWMYSQDANRSTWGNSDRTGQWDANGRWLGYDSNSADLRNLANFAATAAAAYYGGQALAGSGAGGAGAAMTSAEQIAALQAAGMTTAEQVAMMAANGMTDAQIAAALGTQGAQAAGLAGVGGGAAAAGAAGAGAGAAAPAAGSAGAATGLAGAAKTALPWVSAATQLYGTYAQGKAAQDAAAAQQAAAQQGIGEQRRQFDLVQSLLAPYAQAGTKAIGAQADLAGLNGPDAQRAAITALESSPQMAALTKQGETAILQNASATGGLRGGNVQGALATFRPQMLSALIEQQYGRLGGLTSIGQNAAAGTGNAGMATGNNVTQLLGQIGASQAGGALAQGATNAGYAAAIAQLAGMFSGLGQQGPGGTPPIAPTTRGGF